MKMVRARSKYALYQQENLFNLPVNRMCSTCCATACVSRLLLGAVVSNKLNVTFEYSCSGSCGEAGLQTGQGNSPSEHTQMSFRTPWGSKEPPVNPVCMYGRFRNLSNPKLLFFAGRTLSVKENAGTRIVT